MQGGMSLISTILWDVDDTLLDFHAAESAAIKRLFAEFGLGVCTDEMVRAYSAINDALWKRLERNELTKRQVQVSRFEIFFAQQGLDVRLADPFNQRYQLCLGDTIVYRDDSRSIIESLRGRVKQYVVSNGTVVAQSKKLRLSGLGALMDGVFLSEEMGAVKPNKAFFDAVFSAIGLQSPRETMIVGDSLTSDIQGGNNAGIHTCWYNPAGKTADAEYRIDHTISDLHQIYDVLALYD